MEKETSSLSGLPPSKRYEEMTRPIEAWRKRARAPPLVLVDADTGHELLHFVRRRKHFIYLRDKETKRFIKKLDFMELRYFQVVDYSEEQARKGNPLYIDAVGKSLLSPETLFETVTELEMCEIEDYERFETLIGKSLERRLVAMFGTFVVDQLLEDAGIEYSSEPSVTQRVTFGKFYYVVVWKHHKEDQPRSLEGEDNLL